jgi:hypothetical protein
MLNKLALAFLTFLPLQAATITLYNGSLGTSPTAQGWVTSTGAGSSTPDASGVVFDSSSADSIQGGYSRFSNVLNRATGYTVRFDLQVLSEDHSNPNAQNNTAIDSIADRSGVSVTFLSSDLLGIELGFWTDEIWAQNDGAVKADPLVAPSGTRFTHGEGAAFNTTSLTRYDLSVLGATYRLYAGGNFSAPILSGSLRNYSNEGFPYSLANFMFLGDNTTSARGSFRMNLVTLTDSAVVETAAVPEPGTLGLLGLSLVALWFARKNRTAA